MIIYDNPDTGTIIESVLLSEWNDFNKNHYIVKSPILAYTRIDNHKGGHEVRFLVSGTIKEIEYPNLVIKGYCFPVNDMTEHVTSLRLSTFRAVPEVYLSVYYKFNIREDYIKWKLSN